VSNETKSTELAKVETAITSMNAVDAGLADLRKRFGSVVYDVTTPKGMAEAKAARREIAAPRIEVEKIRKEAKAPILELGRKLDAAAKRITDELLKIEGPIDRQIIAEENRVEAERQAKVKAEQDRVAAILGRIQDITGAINGAARARTAADVAQILADIEAIAIDDSFAEFQESAASAKTAACQQIKVMHEAFVAREAEAARLASERAELDRQRAEQEERDRQVEAERRKAREVEERAAKERAELAEMRMAEIMSMGHQVMIATCGRLGVREGGTRECIVETLAETESWTVTEDKFGPLFTMAVNARARACEQIGALLAAFDERERQAAEKRRLDDERAALEARQKAERDAAEAKAREEQEAAARRQREIEDEKRRNYRPTLDEMLEVLASRYCRSTIEVREWLAQSFALKDAA
jgi:colicin import membrane protein